MKSIFTALFSLLLSVAPAMAARQNSTNGRVVDPEGAPIAYATVVLTDQGGQVAGTATDTDGLFSLKAPAGRYRLSITCLGYDSLEQEVETGSDLGTLTLQPASVRMGEVVVKSQLIRREADRFIFDVANSPTAIGKDGSELLRQAPGIWIDDEKISLFGNSGVKVLINERELHLSQEQLISYLRNLRAEEVQRIEIIPMSGADYDADSTAGIIKITLKRIRENGMTGSINLSTLQGKLQESYSPSFNINYHVKGLTLSGRGYFTYTEVDFPTREQTEYLGSETTIRSDNDTYMYNPYGGGSLSAIYDLDDRHSLGIEASLHSDRETSPAVSQTDFTENGATSANDSRYHTVNRINSLRLTFNYIWKLDTLGSQLKLLGSYQTNRTKADNDYHIHTTTPILERDTLYRNFTDADYRVATVNLNYEKVFSDRWNLKAGLKYTRNDMRNSSLYDYFGGNDWIHLPSYSYDIPYVEQIGAGYGIVSGRFGKIGMIAGLRAEYTHDSDRSNIVRKSYLSLFPNANFNWSIDEEKGHSLSLQFSRNIGRPSFWQMNPQRTQISDYSYQTGNPDLKPEFSYKISLTQVLAHKYSLSLIAQFNTDEIQQVFQSNEENPNISYINWGNLGRSEQYVASLHLPFEPTRWLSITANLTGFCRRDRISNDDPMKNHGAFQSNLTTGFKLPGKFLFDIEYFAMSTLKFSNFEISNRHLLSCHLKKRFLDDRLTASLALYNILGSNQNTTARTESFVRRYHIRNNSTRNVSIRLSYNFKAGKSFRKRSIESGADEEASRINR